MQDDDGFFFDDWIVLGADDAVANCDKRDANLIAAAPELLEALQDAVSLLESLVGSETNEYGQIDAQIAECHVAIAKATGETT